MVSFYSKSCRGLKYTGGNTYSKGGSSVAAIIGPGGPSMATKIAVDSPEGPLAAEDQLQHDSTLCTIDIDTSYRARLF